VVKCPGFGRCDCRTSRLPPQRGAADKAAAIGGNAEGVFEAWSNARDFRYETSVVADHREGAYGF
jgi:hypothetical protein